MTIKSQLNRRTFLGTSLATSAALTMGIFPGASWAQNPEPKRGGVFRLAVSGGSTTDSLDPATVTGGPLVKALYGGVCNNLAEVNEEGSIIPELAESITPSADAKTWVFKLRSGISFGNGKPLTADDVIASYNHHRGEESKSGAKSLLAQITEIRKDGPLTVVFELQAGSADFPFVTADYHLMIMPANEDGSLNWAAGLGTGGYLLVEHQPGVRTRLKRRDDYWKVGRAWFDEVELLNINDPATRQNALVTGEVDVINQVDLKTVHLLRRKRDIRIEEVTGTYHFTMPMLTDIAPFDNVDVRLAMKYSIDREEMLQKVLRGFGRVGNDHPIAPANRFFAADLEQRSYDPDRAKFHLGKAGYSSLDIDVSASEAAFNGATDAAILFKESAAKSGINVTVKREPNDGYWSNVWMKKPVCFASWSGRPTEDWMLSLAFASGVDWNDSHWSNEHFDKVLLEARSELDEGRRREMYYDLQKVVRNDGGVAIPLFANYVDASSTRVAHGKLASNGYLDGWKIVERWWSAV
jgi:peptide/nickel transport system substrate-binding protein